MSLSLCFATGALRALSQVNSLVSLRRELRLVPLSPKPLVSKSPTARSLEECRKRGWTCGVVEKFIPYTKTRVDLFGVIDLIALDDQPGCLGIQATSTPNMAARVTKAKGEPRLRVWLERGNRFVVWGWAKRGPQGKRKTYTLREQELRLGDVG